MGMSDGVDRGGRRPSRGGVGTTECEYRVILYHRALCFSSFLYCIYSLVGTHDSTVTDVADWPSLVLLYGTGRLVGKDTD